MYVRSLVTLNQERDKREKRDNGGLKKKKKKKRERKGREIGVDE